MNKGMEGFKYFLSRLTELSLYVMVFSLPLSKSAIEICAIVAISCWALRKLLMGADGMKLAPGGLNRPMLVFYLISFLSIFRSTDPSASFSAFLTKLSEYVLLYFIVVETITDKRMVRNIAIAAALSVSVGCLDAVYQLFTGSDLIRGYPLHSLERMTGPFKFPNGFSGWLIVIIFPITSVAIFFKENKAVKSTCILLLALTAYCVFYGFTRAAFLSLLLGMGIMFMLASPRRSIIVLALVLIALPLLVIFLPDGAKNHVYLLKIFGGSSTGHRLMVWTAGLKMFLERPVLGQGYNMFMANYARFRLPEDSGIWYAHNSYLQIAAETGILGLVSFIWVIAKAAVISLRSWRSIGDSLLKFIYLGLFCGIVSFLVLSFFDVTHFSLRPAVLFYLSLGVLIAINNIGSGVMEEPGHGKV
ncbi:MAG: O-antigen ligase family protein [Candidatus Omnitrophota bacterium]